ncbi:hypothetical protein WJ96_05635 [Burkholderia ubonensis]|uniref:Iron uptake protein n=1 Tax=Burkholderia ubonensis TaxID=101571 RepID=A0AAW3N231_9BURK|nr:hypothetical protein [Burkholderia ubonensis]KVP75238.1 hypothetical protein WJ93_07430 [Burkholderia ubonensis]KVP98051.1 hypothetical protein WJ96_05635 [Burkholderia ubonensis]KVZ92748.1 hypothetical protein WL25_17295 [Burkholderia ubonensis]
MTADRFDDLRATALGVGGALLAYYGYAVSLVLAGNTSLDRPVTWLGLAGGVAAVSWATRSSTRRRAPTSVAS